MAETIANNKSKSIIKGNPDNKGAADDAFKSKINPDTIKTPRDQLTYLSDLYLGHKTDRRSQHELEVRFGTKGVKYLTGQDLSNVVNKLLSCGYIQRNTEPNYTLKIYPDTLNARTGQFMSGSDKLRIEIGNIVDIQSYCKVNSLSSLQKSGAYIQVKSKKNLFIDDKPVKAAEYNNFNFRVTYQVENNITGGPAYEELFAKWTDYKKTYRLVKRYSYSKGYYGYPFMIDISFVKMSTRSDRGYPISTFTIEESNVFNNPEIYELEIEVMPVETLISNDLNYADILAKEIENVAKLVLSGLQQTNFPISYPEQYTIQNEYLDLVFGAEKDKNGKGKGEEVEEDGEKEGKKDSREDRYIRRRRIDNSDFIGPSSQTLQIKNISALDPNVYIPNITAPNAFCVTEKADGERALMFINGVGKIYLINQNMSVIFTGARTVNEECFNSILDGELILRNEKGEYINLYAAFDIYYIHSVEIRTLPFMEVPIEDKEKSTKIYKHGCRLNILNKLVSELDLTSVVKSKSNTNGNVSAVSEGINKLMDKSIMEPSPIRITVKKFYPYFDLSEKSKACFICGNQHTTDKCTWISNPIDLNTIMKMKSKDYQTNIEQYKRYREYLKNRAKYETNIFSACSIISQHIKDNHFEYNVDGLIFTPTLFGVGGNNILEAGRKGKGRWDYSFKWKPAEYNTIDFLISTKKDANGADVVTPIFEKGNDMTSATQLTQYKTMILAVGYDSKKHGYINPCIDLLEDRIPDLLKQETGKGRRNDTYRPQQFVPSEPYDVSAGICNIVLKQDTKGNYEMFTEEGEIITDNSVVEFKYDQSRPPLMKWVPLRLRPDKTNEARNKISYGNDYNTANSNWYSIHNPVTDNMIFLGKDIPADFVSDDVYYNNNTSEKLTKGMRDFHNLYVKRKLILSVSRSGNTLIDYACGKGGDFPKWISANLDFVFGIDISKDNIENRKDGACARFLNFKSENKKTPYALFVNGDSSRNIRDGRAMLNDKDIMITKSIFGSININKELGPAVERQHNKGNKGFNVSSCQFAVHYMFQSKDTFYNFIRNVADCTRVNGYFIGTCYDGNRVFDLLKGKSIGEGVSSYVDETKKVWSITKNYELDKMEDNVDSLGKEILVYQDSINQTLPEYLVNFRFFTSELEKFGFKLVSRNDARDLGMPNGTGLFDELYNKMMDEIRKFPKSAKEYGMAPSMMDYEKKISFLNRYFVFQKIATRNVEKLTKSILETLPDEVEFE